MTTIFRMEKNCSSLHRFTLQEWEHQEILEGSSFHSVNKDQKGLLPWPLSAPCHHSPHILPRHCRNTLSKVFLIRELESTGKYSSSIAGCITRSTPGLTLTSRVDARSGVRVADGASCSFKCMTYCLVLNSGQDKCCQCKLY